ncbi:MAG: acyl-CoA/acyl-ACP dehydrogenase [Gammaproteobacteria bacterium]|nr:acyl-CoA/acyl-ACP dehydrogenase [Gammaproteobacteria bacterium]
MDFEISEEIREIGNALIKFIDQEVVPLEKKHADLLADPRKMYGPDQRYTEEFLALRKTVRMKSAEAGFYNVFGAEQLGGMEMGPFTAAHLYEVMNEKYGPDRPLIHTVVIPSPFTNGLSPILRFLNPDIIDEVCPSIASGEKTLCCGISEPDAGSDVFNMKTTAVKDGDEWVINGTKQWITNSPYADYCMLFAITDPEAFKKRTGTGISGFFIDTKTPGFTVPSVIPVMGAYGSETGIVSLENVRVHKSRMLGKENQGFKVLMTGVNTGRVGMSASCVGMAKWGLEQSLEYSKTRKTFGQPIAEYQAIQIKLAEMAMNIYAARNMVLHCAWKLEKGEKALKEISIIKAFCTEMLSKVMDEAIQIHGGMGLTNELKIEAGYRYARIMRIPDGTAEIQRRTIARQLLSGDTDI